MKQQNAKRDIFLMLFFAAAAAALLLWVFPNYITVTKLMEQEVFTPRTFPSLIAYGMLIVSCIGLVEAVIRYAASVKENGKQPRQRKTAQEWKDTVFPYFIYSLIVVYVILYRLFGIIIATVAVPPIMLWCLNCRKWKAYAAFYVFSAIIYLLFTQVLLVPLK